MINLYNMDCMTAIEARTVIYMNHTTLTDYQIAESFGDTLSLIYRDKIEELNAKLQPIWNHLEQFNIPRYTDFDRWFARQALPLWAKRDIKAIEHMDRIKQLRRNPQVKEKLDIEKARSIPITSVYAFKRRGTNVSCPFHGDDKNPSASIKYNYFVCFGCGLKLDGIALKMKLENIGFKDAVTEINKLS